MASLPHPNEKELQVTYRNDVICLIAVLLLLYGLFPSMTDAADKDPGQDEVRISRPGGDGDGVTEQLVTDEDTGEERSTETHTIMGGAAGYRFLAVDRNGGRAATYEYLHPSAVGGLFYNRLGKDLKFALEGTYLNDKDYHGDLLYDYSGYYRVHLRTESLFHNLDHDPLFTPAFTFVNDQRQPATYSPVDLDPARTYGVRVEQDLGQFRYKLPYYPLHVNLGYWRLLREGDRQLRFADQTFEATANTIYSATRAIDRETHEGSLGLDAHVGPVDFVYTFLIRQFGDNTAVPRDFFATRTTLPQQLQHNEDPDSRYMAHTIKLHSSLDGGITAGASYTFGSRDNLSRLSDVRGVELRSATIRNAAADFSYVPCANFTLALKYRRQDVDNDSPSTILTSFFSQPVPVRPAFSVSKDAVTATMSFRPLNLLTFKGEYKGEFTHRDLSVFSDETLNWHGLPENSATHKGTFAVLSRPVKGLRLKAQYSYAATDHPAYGTTPSERHEGQFLATYSRANTWGVTANYHSVRDRNDDINRLEITSVSPLTYVPVSQPLARDKATDNVTTSVWFTPFAPLTISGSYGFLRSNTDQGIMFTVVSPSLQDIATYTSLAQIYSVSGVYRFSEKLSLSLALQQIRSSSEFDPRPVATVDTSGLKDISRVKAVESSISARADYRFSELISCALDYSYRDYDEKNSSLFDGSVHTIIASLAARW